MDRYPPEASSPGGTAVARTVKDGNFAYPLGDPVRTTLQGLAGAASPFLRHGVRSATRFVSPTWSASATPRWGSCAAAEPASIKHQAGDRRTEASDRGKGLAIAAQSRRSDLEA